MRFIDKKIIFSMHLILVFVFCMFYKIDIIYADYEEYYMNDYVYFDPITDNKCDEKNYWTMYNQNTTCYRFIVLGESNSQNEEVRIMLDHNVINTKYDDISSTLSVFANRWVRYNGSLDTISEIEAAEILKLESMPTEPNTSAAGGYSYFTINSIYTQNKVSNNYYGFWTKDAFNDNYAYSLTENANNRIISRNEIRGLRPVLTINKELLNKFKNNVHLTLDEYDYTYPGIYEAPSYYTQLQGFTISNDKIFFYATTGSDKTGGYIAYSPYGDKENRNYQSKYIEAGHGNDMTYNSNDDTILVVGPNNYKKIYKYDTTQVEKITEYTYESGASAIGYDPQTDYYATAYGNMIDIIKINNGNFEKIYSFSFPHNETPQGIEYHNGYVYATTYKNSSDKYKDYSTAAENSAVIYVYNARFNKVNNQFIPSKAFGKLVKTIYIDTLEYEKNSQTYYGEIETISFHDNKVYLGYATPYDTNKAYKFYEMAESQLAVYPPSGDVNGDDIVDIDDMKKIAEYIIGEVEFSKDKLYDADTDEDGKIKMNDIMLLINEINQ